MAGNLISALRHGLRLGVATTALVANQATALPAGGTVVGGAPVAIDTNGGTMTITQSSPSANPRSAINWTGFNIANGETARFEGPSGGAVLNRVSGAATTIAGRLEANGPQIFVVNPAGVIVSSTGQVVANAGFVASTLDISPERFLAGGKLDFAGNGGMVDNSGSITAGGFAVLLGQTVRNGGTVSVPLGRIALGGATAATLDPSGDGFLQLTLAADPALDAMTQVSHNGKIDADGGRILLSAGRVATAFEQVVNVPSTLRARSANGRAGVIELRSTVAAGDLSVRGSIDASGGGSVVIDGPSNVSIIGPTGITNASNALTIQTGISATDTTAGGGRIDISSGNTLQTFNAVRLLADASTSSTTAAPGVIRLGGEYRFGAGPTGDPDYGVFVPSTLPALQLAATTRIGNLTQLSARSPRGGSINVTSNRSTTFAAAYDTNLASQVQAGQSVNGGIAITSRGRVQVNPSAATFYSDNRYSATRFLLGGRNLLTIGETTDAAVSELINSLSTAERLDLSLLPANNLFQVIGQNATSIRFEGSDAVRLFGNFPFDPLRAKPIDLTVASGRALLASGRVTAPNNVNLRLIAGDTRANNGRGADDVLAGSSILDARALTYGRGNSTPFVNFKYSNGTLALTALGNGGRLLAPTDDEALGFREVDLTLGAPSGTIELAGRLTARRLNLTGSLRVTQDTALGTLQSRQLDSNQQPLTSGVNWSDQAAATVTGTDAKPLFHLYQETPFGSNSTLLTGRLDGAAAAVITATNPTVEYGLRESDIDKAVFGLRGQLRAGDSLAAIATSLGYRKLSTPSLSSGGYVNAGSAPVYARSVPLSDYPPDASMPAGYLLNAAASVPGPTLKVTPRQVSLSGSTALSKTYGDANPALPGLNGVLAGDDAGLVQTLKIDGKNPLYTDERIPAGKYVGDSFLNGPDRLNYVLSSGAFSLDVAKRPLKISLLTPTATYGSAPTPAVGCSFAAPCVDGLQFRWDAIDWAALGKTPLAGDTGVSLAFSLIAENGERLNYSATNGERPPTNAGTYAVPFGLFGTGAGNYDIASPEAIFGIRPFEIRASVLTDLFYGFQQRLCTADGCTMQPETRSFITVASTTAPTPVTLEVALQPKGSSSTTKPATPVTGTSNGVTIATNYEPRLLPDTYAASARLTGSNAGNYTLNFSGESLTVRKSIIGYRISGGTGEAISGLGFVGTPPGAVELNGAVAGDSVQLVTAVFSGADLNDVKSTIIPDVALASPGSYHLQAAGLIADKARYELGAPGGIWGQGAALTVRQPLSQLTLVAPAAIAAVKPVASAGITVAGPTATASALPALASAGSASSASGLSSKAATQTGAGGASGVGAPSASASNPLTIASTSVGTSSTTSVASNVDVVQKAEAGAEAGARLQGVGASATATANQSVQISSVAGTTEIGTSASASVSAKISLISTSPSLQGSVAVKLEDYVQQTIKGDLGGGVSGQAQAKTAVFAQALSTTTIGVQDGKVTVGTEQLVGAGASVGATGGISSGGVGTTAGATVYSPGSIGFGFTPSVGVSDGKLSIGGSLGSAIGVGGLKVNFSIEIDASAVADVGKGVGNALADLGSQIGSRISNFFTGGGSSGPQAPSPTEYVSEGFRRMDPIANAEQYLNAYNSKFANGTAVKDQYAVEMKALGIDVKAKAAADYLKTVDQLKPLLEQQAKIVDKLVTNPASLTAADMQAYQSITSNAPKLMTDLKVTLASVGKDAKVGPNGNLIIVAAGRTGP